MKYAGSCGVVGSFLVIHKRETGDDATHDRHCTQDPGERQLAGGEACLYVAMGGRNVWIRRRVVRIFDMVLLVIFVDCVGDCHLPLSPS